MITLLTRQDMEKVFTMAEAVQAAKDALALYSAGDTDIPLRANLPVPAHNGSALYMYGYAPGASALGVKIVSVYPDNPKRGLPSVPATMVLMDDSTGAVSSLMDGTYLTRVRTGAVAGAATDLLARRDSRVFALFGAGGQAEGQLEAVLTVRDIELAKVYCRTFEKAEAFARAMSEKFSGRFNTKIVAVHSPEEAIADADVITAATTAVSPVFDGRLLKPGAHVNGIGSFTYDMVEIDSYTLTHAGKVYADTLEGVLGEAGDILQPIDRGEYSKDRMTGELGQLINGAAPGRESDTEITFFKSVGSAVLDLVTARRIYAKAKEMGIGLKVEM